MYLSGKGVPQDYVEAARWYRRAAEQGDAGAQTSLGVIYANGYSVLRNYDEAARWWHRAADQGDASAQANLGVMYDKGYGVPQDNVEAAQWYRRAAEQGLVFAQFSLGLMYYNGEGVPRDYGKAHMWLDLATLTSSVDTDTQERWRQARDAVAQLLSPEELARAQRVAREWRPKGETQSPSPQNAGADGDTQ